MLSSDETIRRTANHVRNRLSGEGSGHDWWHVARVWKVARRIGLAEGADLLVVELAALLHDLADWKAYGGDLQVGPQAARDWLASFELAPGVTEHVCRIITDISFKGAGVEQPELSWRAGWFRTPIGSTRWVPSGSHGHSPTAGPKGG